MMMITIFADFMTGLLAVPSSTESLAQDPLKDQLACGLRLLLRHGGLQSRKATWSTKNATMTAAHSRSTEILVGQLKLQFPFDLID